MPPVDYNSKLFFLFCGAILLKQENLSLNDFKIKFNNNLTLLWTRKQFQWLQAETAL